MNTGEAAMTAGEILLKYVLPGSGWLGIIITIGGSIRNRIKNKRLDRREEKLNEERRVSAANLERIAKNMEKTLNLIYASMKEKMAKREPDRDREEIAAASAEVVCQATEAAFGTPFVFKDGTFIVPETLVWWPLAGVAALHEPTILDMGSEEK